MGKALDAADRDASPSAWVAENTRWIICINKWPLLEPHVNSVQQTVTKCLQRGYHWSQGTCYYVGRATRVIQYYLYNIQFLQNLNNPSPRRQVVLSKRDIFSSCHLSNMVVCLISMHNSSLNTLWLSFPKSWCTTKRCLKIAIFRSF